ncbi:MAG: UMP kinase [Bacteroidia bacterium]|nr:UMP kinase [Bacteroidia bacterium]
MKYKRILLKLSGESLMGKQHYGIDTNKLNEYALQIKKAVESGIQIGIVIGGGNIFRGLTGTGKGYDRVKGDYMGMLATVINSLALQSALENIEQPARVMTAIPMEPVGERFSKQKSIASIEHGEVIIFSFGTGNPYFTTDTAAALRAVEIEADILLKGTRVDGVYSDNPEKDKTAVKFDDISFDEVIERELKVMDLTAITLCKENNLSILVFNMDIPGNLIKILSGEKIGTIVG